MASSLIIQELAARVRSWMEILTGAQRASLASVDMPGPLIVSDGEHMPEWLILVAVIAVALSRSVRPRAITRVFWFVALAVLLAHGATGD